MLKTIVPKLEIARFRLDFVLEGPRELPNQYLGSAWRGAFGHALRQSVCVTKAPTCEGCGLLNTCPYPALFESRTPENATKLSRYPLTPSPYVLQPDNIQDRVLRLGLVLYGTAAKQFSVVSLALRRAAEKGLTERRVKLRLQSIAKEYSFNSNSWTQDLDAPVQFIETGQPPDQVRVRLLTPLRIKEQGRHVGATEFRFRAFAANLLRRVSLLTHFFGESALEADFRDGLAQAEKVRLDNVQLKWRDWARFSSRQGTGMKLGGLIGEFEIGLQSIEFLWPCLLIGQWTHVGKNCTFGLGRYVIEPIVTSANPSWPTPAPLQQDAYDKLVNQDRSWQRG